MPRDLRDRVIVITGASSGIGAATAIACAEAGMDVVLNARREDRLRAVAAEVEATGRRATVLTGCVTEAGISEKMLDAAERAFGRVDVVFANAGYGANLAVVDHPDDALRRMFDVNFFASVDLLRVAARHLLARERGGHLLMCSSCLSKMSLPDHGAYAATKAAQNAMCSAMRLEHSDHGIYVSSVHPITTTTEFFEVSARVSGHEPPTTPKPEHAPDFFTQGPDRVARAVVRCLRRPCPEVWTSHIVRAVAGVGTVFPRFGDWSVRTRARTKRKAGDEVAPRVPDSPGA